MAQLKAAWLAVKAAWFWLKWVLVLAALLSLYVKGRADGASACEQKAQEQRTAAAEAEVARAVKQAEQDAAQARQDAAVAQARADEREKARSAAQARVRTLEAQLASVPGPEVCRLPTDALNTLKGSMK